METRITKWHLKGKAARFGRDWFGYILHHIGTDPACIMGFENTGTPYSTQVYELFKESHSDIKHGEISVNNGKVTGFTKEYVKDRKIVVITENPRDRGALYIPDIVKKYFSKKDDLNIRGLTIITVEPFKMYEAEQIMKKRSFLY